MIPEFRHYSFHRPFVFFQQFSKLLVFVEKCLVFYYYLRIHALEFRLEEFCSNTSIENLDH